MNKNNIKLIKYLIISYILVKSVFLLFELSSNSIYIVLLTGLSTYILNKYELKKDNRFIPCLIYSFLIAIVLTLQHKIIFNGDVWNTPEEFYINSYNYVDIFRVIILTPLLYIFVYGIVSLFKSSKLSVLDKKKEYTKKESFKFFIIFFILIAIPFLLVLLTYYPGAVLNDSISSLYQVTGRNTLMNNHPVFYTLFVGLLYVLGKMIHSPNLGIFFYSLVQLLIMSGILSYFLLWLRKKNVRLELIILTYIYFVCNSLFAYYAIAMWKDPLFCGFLFLMSLYIFDIIKSKGEVLKDNKKILYFVLLNFLIAFLRNNGIFILIGICIALLIKFKKEIFRFQIINIVSIVIIIIIQGPVYSKLGIITPSEESYGIPLQQIARVIYEDGNINEKEITTINNLMSYNIWKESYHPGTVDAIKWNKNFNKEYLKENKIEFLSLWFKLLPKNFNTYVDAYLLQTYGFWSIGTNNYYGLYSNNVVKNYLDIFRKDLIKDSMGVSLKDYIKEPSTPGIGTLLWIMVFSSVLLIIIKKKEYILVYLPSIILMITLLIATPVTFCFRYAFVLAYLLPLFILMPFMLKDNK